MRPKPFIGRGDDNISIQRLHINGIMRRILNRIKIDNGTCRFCLLGKLRRETPAWLPLRAFRPGADPLLNFAEALGVEYAKLVTGIVPPEPAKSSDRFEMKIHLSIPMDGLDQSRQLIDMMALLLEKTKGNLTLDEKRLLENSLTELRFRFVQAGQEQ